MDGALISIVIPVYNRASVVRQTLDSVAAQTWRPLHIILVDNASTDSTLSVLESWKSTAEAPDFRITVVTEKKPGACAARNAGLAKVTTPWTMFFDSDDIMLPHHIARAMKAATESECDIVGWDTEDHLLSGKIAVRKFASKNLYFNNIMHSSFGTLKYMALTSLFREAGGWNESISYMDDAELGLRLIKLNPTVIYIHGRPSVIVNQSSDSITANHKANAEALRNARIAMRRITPESQRHLIDLQIILLCSSYGKGEPEAELLVKEIIRDLPARRAFIFRLLRLYTLHKGRGAAKIYNALCSLQASMLIASDLRGLIFFHCSYYCFYLLFNFDIAKVSNILN